MRIIDLILNLEIQEGKSYSFNDVNSHQNIIVNGDIIQVTLEHYYNKRSNMANALNDHNITYFLSLPRHIDVDCMVFLSIDYKYLIVWDYSNNKDEVIVLDIQDVRSQCISYSTIQYGKILQYELGY